jgi:hypothetical protein
MTLYSNSLIGQKGNIFEGLSNGNNTISRDSALPEGIYFYTLTYKNASGLEKKLSGYFILNRVYLGRPSVNKYSD